MRSSPSRHSFGPSLTGLLVIVLAMMAWPQPLPAAMTEHVLDNGMRVVLRPEATNPVVCSAVLVRAGVAWEPEGMSGASHFLEHLLFNGTTRRTQEQLYADVDALVNAARASRDAEEGIAARLEKRAPRFTGE